MRPPWDEQTWRALDIRMRRRPETVAREARSVLRAYSTSFFLVTRFLPPGKRSQVEIVYAAVRYPDEIVDTFPLGAEQRHALLNQWAAGYESALLGEAGAPPFVAAFANLVKRHSIPHDYYRSFLDAMRRDIDPRPFASLDDLIDSYIYGSAIVVGYFLAYVYGASDFARAIESSRNLGIALQLTNFVRDVAEDAVRGRIYIPQDYLRRERLDGAVRSLSRTAERYYSASERDLGAFSPDCIPAIRACIDVYRALNRRIGAGSVKLNHRESVPPLAKFRALPVSKYWRLPLAYLGAL